MSARRAVATTSLLLATLVAGAPTSAQVGAASRTTSRAPTSDTLADDGARPRARRVLILNGFRSDMSELERSLREFLHDSVATPPEIAAEHLDGIRFADPAARALFADYVARRHAASPPDVIVAAYGPALQVLAEARGGLFPGAPVVVSGINEGELPPRAREGLRGVLLPTGVARTVQLARRLQPEATRLVLVAGASPLERRYVELVHGLLPAEARALDVEVLAGQSLADVGRRLAALDRRAITLYIVFLQDPDGTPRQPRDVAARLARTSGAPLYVFADAFMAPEVLGGFIGPLEEQGRETGRMVRALLAGDTAVGRPTRTLPGRNVVNWRALDRWGIPPRALPAGTTIRARPPGIWQQYRRQVLAGSGVLVLQTALIGALVAARVRERRAQERIANLSAFERLVADVSLALGRSPAETTGEAVGAALERIGGFLGAERVRLWELPVDAGMRLLRTWTAPQAAAPPGDASAAADAPPGPMPTAPAIEREVRSGRVLRWSDRDALPPELRSDEAVLREAGVRGALVLPLRLADEVVGALTFTMLTRDGGWPDAIVERIGPVAGQLALFVASQRSATLARESRDVSDAVLASLEARVVVIDGEGRVRQANDAWVRARAQAPSAAADRVGEGDDLLAALAADAAAGLTGAARTREAVVRALGGGVRGAPAVVEFARRDGDGARWFEGVVEPLSPAGRGAVLALFDTTRRREAEAEAQAARQQLAHMGRVATLGELTASLSHELRQPLTAVRVNAQAVHGYLSARADALPEVLEALADVDRHARRADDVIERLRALYRNEEWRPVPVSLDAVVRETVALLAGDAALRGTAIALDLEAGTPAVLGDAVQLQQVVMNLVLNGVEAMAVTPPAARALSVRTRATAEGAAELLVEDAGPGIPEAVLGRVFDPFFTTKRSGMGMGLAVTRSVVRAHGGTIEAANRVGGGARVRVVLPAAARGEDQSDGVPSAAGEAAARPAGARPSVSAS